MAKITNELRECQNIPRKLIFDNTISDRARFVYCFMAAKPEDWDFFLEPMAKEIGYSVETLRKYINELVVGGWLVKGEQTNEDGRFGAVEYTIKAAKVLPTTDLPHTKNTDTENFRHGKNPTQHKIDNIHKIDDLHNKEEKEKELKEKFAEFIKTYKRLTGKQPRGIDTEFGDFKKRHKDWREVIPYLSIAIQREMQDREQARIQRKFFPEPKMLQTYLGKQRAWEMYVTIGEDIDAIKNTYTPQGRTIWFNEQTKSYWSDDNFYYGTISDGYTDDNRPDGATLTLNNARGDIRWNSNTKQWEKV